MITTNQILSIGSIDDFNPYEESTTNDVVWEKENVPVRVRTTLLNDKQTVSVTAFHEDGEEVFLLEFPINGTKEEQIETYHQQIAEIIEWWINTELSS